MATVPQANPSTLELLLLNSFQRNFPVTPSPFSDIAQRIGSDERTVIDTLRILQDEGTVSRVGAVFRPNAVGASTLAALAVAPERLDEVARLVSAFPEVNHNYEREHRFNLWFVATADSSERLRAALRDIEDASACGSLLVLPLIEDYHIDLGFDLLSSSVTYHFAGCPLPARPQHRAQEKRLTSSERTLLAALQDGLPLVERPFACLGLPEAQAIDLIGRWVDGGVIKRFGVIVRHHELGYTANAMCVWDVPDAVVREVGQRIAGSGQVTLCYRRPRRLPAWRYNLFCMIHGKDRSEVDARVAALSEACGLGGYPREVLYSRRRFKQRGARYAPAAAATEVSHG